MAVDREWGVGRRPYAVVDGMHHTVIVYVLSTWETHAAVQPLQCIGT
jgi:hypothetical protein